MFRRFLVGIDILQALEGETTAMTEVKTMVTEKETGMFQNHEPLAATTIATKMRDQTQGFTDQLLPPVKADLIDHGIHTGMTHFLHTRRKMVHFTPTPLKLVCQMSHMGCILFQL